MTSRRTGAALTAVLVLSGLAAAPGAFAHGSMTDPVSRVAACHAEGPESPRSAACRAAVAASGTQAFYDWNGVNIANAAGNHHALVPDGELCSAGNPKYRGLDLARADWPATRMNSGAHTFRYRGTAPHRGSFALYLTKEGYDPAKPLRWADLEAEPFLTVTDPRMENGDYVFEGTVPERSGRHLIYSVWQRSDSPEAFYTCSDVVFGEGADARATGRTPTGAPTARTPAGEPAAEGTAGATAAGHGEHGGHVSPTAPAPAPTGSAPAPAAGPADPAAAPDAAAAPGSGSGSGSGSGEVLAETGGDGATPYLALGGAAVFGLGAAVLFAAARRRSAR